MSDWQSGYVESNGIRLHYTRTGGTKPPLVLAHGVTDDGLCWTPVADSLATDYDVVMVDARGHGRSDAPEHGYDPTTQAADLAGAIAGLGLHRPVILGHSMGAVTTLVLAGTHPEVPAAILLEDPPAWWISPAESPTPGDDRRAGWRRWIHDLKRKTRDELLADQRIEMPTWSEAELDPWANAKLRFSINVLDLFSFDPAATVDWPSVLARVNCPTLLIAGDPARGAIVDQRAADALNAVLPQLRVAQVADAGHSIHRDQFDRYLDAVRAFLKGV